VRGQRGSVALGIGLLLGLYFSFLQGLECVLASFSISDSIYGRVFFVATGFHGVHVIVGSMSSLVCIK
jgi:heme/copper-type cytochrome/quinol oxidase subunit 3